MTRRHLDQGRWAEDLAVQWLIKNRYRPLERNYRNLFGEIDIIAKDGQTLCFIEVRSRSTTDHGHPFESISMAKQEKLIRTAQGYLARQDNLDNDCRFDIVAVTPQENGEPIVEIIKDAFDIE